MEPLFRLFLYFFYLREIESQAGECVRGLREEHNHSRKKGKLLVLDHRWLVLMKLFMLVSVILYFSVATVKYVGYKFRINEVDNKMTDFARVVVLPSEYNKQD